jgi:3-isopropylmalate/(R)-2-methylmalate dehydratase small subunit
VETDQINPRRLLKSNTREEFGDNLFAEWRLNKDGKSQIDIVLNNPDLFGRILLRKKISEVAVAASMRPWAIGGYGLKVVESSFFADIFP